jgi:glutamate-ammonia-ligase adenylyltransferase
LRGGQEPELRARNLLTVLAVLAKLGIIEADKAAGLADSYRFLRMSENRLQALNDQQTHEIPDDEQLRVRWAYAAGYSSWRDFAVALDRHRDRVQQAFDEFHWQSDDDERGTEDSIRVAWDGGRLAEAEGYPWLEPLDQFRGSGLYRRMDEISRQRLGAFVSALVPALECCNEPHEVLARVMPVIRSICRRSA